MNQMPDTATRVLPKVSVIIPTYNEERYVGQCIQSVRKQIYPSDLVEIIVVDNGSTDDTLAICEGAADLVLNQPGIRVGAMRNRGAHAASGEVLAFLDADCVAHPEWLSNATCLLWERPCVTGNFYDLPPNPHWIERAWYAQEQSGRRTTQLIPTGNMLLLRSSFMRLGGFDESLPAGEDAEFCLRAAQRFPVIADDGVRVVHLGNPSSMSKFLARETWHGMGALGTAKIRRLDKPLAGTILFAILSVLQVFGCGWIIVGASAWPLILSTIGVVLLLFATVGYRLRILREWRAVPALIVLYYLYYLGRSHSLIKLLGRKQVFRRVK
jgi:glycosyltransferase involved in cell wall biosynthesis